MTREEGKQATCCECVYHVNFGEWQDPCFCDHPDSDHNGHFLIGSHPACEYRETDLAIRWVKEEE